MNSTTYESSREREQVNNEIVIQITKKQLVTFASVLFVLVLIGINVLAITAKSPLLKELLISEAILLMIVFVKTSKSNTISK